MDDNAIVGCPLITVGSLVESASESFVRSTGRTKLEMDMGHFVGQYTVFRFAELDERITSADTLSGTSLVY